MANKKRYYWLKLKEDFFRQKEIKRLRKIAGGDTYTIIYLKLLLLGIQSGGKLFFEGFENTFAEELALEMDEDDDNVEVTLSFLTKHGLAEMVDEHEMVIVETSNLTGSESKSAERVRKHRAQKEVLQSNANLLHCNTSVTNCNTEIEIDKEIDIDIEIDDRDREKKTSSSSVDSVDNFSLIEKEWNKVRNQSIIIKEHMGLISSLISEYKIKKILLGINKISESKYLTKNANIEWFLQEKNFINVLNDKYKDFEIQGDDVLRKTAFHNFPQVSSTYTNEELEKIWRK